jgi:trigger factor
MKSTLEPLEGNKVKLSVEVDESEFDRDIDQAFRKIAKEVRIPGFRPGKAPRRILESRIGVGPAREEALRDAIPRYLADAVREHEVDIIATPQVDITGGEEDGPVAFDATIEVRPVITVPGYGGLRVEVPNPDVSDAEIDERIASLRRPHGELVDVERPAVMGDFVTIDLGASRDGEAVPGLNVDDWQYEIGRGWITPEFDSHLVGTTAGDDVDFEAPLPGSADDRPVEFSVTVTKVQEMVLPELTDEWVADNVDDVETVEALRERQRTQLELVRRAQGQQQLVDRTVTALANLVDEEPPEALVAAELDRRAQDLVMRLQAQGIAFEQYLAATGQDQAEIVESLRTASVEAVKIDLALRAVAEAESLTAADSEVDSEIERIAVQVKQKPNQVRKAYERNDALPGLRADLRKRKALDWLLERVEVVDPEGTPIDRARLLPGSPDGTPDDAEAGAVTTNEETPA